MPIYDINYNLQVQNLLPPHKRKSRILAWLFVNVKPLQWLHDNFFNEYADGSTAPYFNSITIYSKGNRVIDPRDHGVYESTFDFITNGNPNPSIDTAHWQKVTDDFRGVRERVKYTGQKLSLEYALNKWFRTTFRQPPLIPDIYITNNALTDFVFICGATADSSSAVSSSALYAQNFIVYDDIDFAAAAFTIWFPVAVWTALGSSADERNAIIRSFANNYVIAGMIYNIDTY